MKALGRRFVQYTTEAGKLLVVHGPGADITAFEGDAIVNAANEKMLGGGGVDGAIHRAAGPALRQRCLEVEPVRSGVRCPTGEARVTDSCNLACSRVIHTVGPYFSSREQSEPALRSAVDNSLSAAEDENLSSVCLPAISTGVYGYPHSLAADATLDVASQRPESSPLAQIHFALMGESDVHEWIAAADNTSSLKRVNEDQEDEGNHGNASLGQERQRKVEETEEGQNQSQREEDESKEHQ